MNRLLTSKHNPLCSTDGEPLPLCSQVYNRQEMECRRRMFYYDDTNPTAQVACQGSHLVIDKTIFEFEIYGDELGNWYFDTLYDDIFNCPKNDDNELFVEFTPREKLNIIARLHPGVRM